MNTLGETYKFEETLPKNGQVIEVQNPMETWLEVLFSGDESSWELIFEEEDVVSPDEVLETFPTWREEQLKIMTRK